MNALRLRALLLFCCVGLFLVTVGMVAESFVQERTLLKKKKSYDQLQQECMEESACVLQEITGVLQDLADTMQEFIKEQQAIVTEAQACIAQDKNSFVLQGTYQELEAYCAQKKNRAGHIRELRTTLQKSRTKKPL